MPDLSLELQACAFNSLRDISTSTFTDISNSTSPSCASDMLESFLNPPYFSHLTNDPGITTILQSLLSNYFQKSNTSHHLLPATHVRASIISHWDCCLKAGLLSPALAHFW